MWENETKEQNEALPQNKPYTLMMPPKSADDNDKIMLMQTAICVAVIVFVLFAKFVSTPLFTEFKQQYQQIISSGIDLSEKGEIVRFISVITQNIKEKVLEVFNQIEASSGGAQEGSEISFLAADLPYRLSVLPYKPVEYGNVSSGFGKRKNPVTEKTEMHSGLDIAANQNQHVFSSYGGQVEKCGEDKIRGKYVIIKHTSNMRTLYQHLSKIYIKSGDSILRGQIIAAVGSTGMSTGPHLHYELIIDNVCVNPQFALRY